MQARRRRLPLWVNSLAIIVFIAAAAGAAGQYERDTINERTITSTHTQAVFSARLAASAIGTFVSNQEANLPKTVAIPAIANYANDPTRPCLIPISGPGNIGSGYSVFYNADGSIHCVSSTPPRPTRGYASAPWIADSLQRPLFLRDTVDPTTGKAVMIFTAPVPLADCYIASIVDLDSIGPFLVQQFGGPNAFAFTITGTQGRTVFSNSADPERGTNVSTHNRAFSQSGVVEARGLDGVLRIYGGATVPSLGWKVFATEPVSRATAKGRAFLHTELFLGALLIVLVIVGILTINRRITKPIARLHAVLHQVRSSSNKDVTPTVPVAGPVEVASIAEEINLLFADRVRLERQRLQAQKLESVGRLAGGVAHDFNNLLGAILGYSAIASKQLGAAIEGGSAPDLDSIRGDLDKVSSAVERGGQLTRQLLAFSRREPAGPVCADLNGVVEGTLGLLERTVGDEISLVFVPADGPCLVRGDDAQLEALVVNLVLNARDAMPQGGTITIDTSRDVQRRDRDGAAQVPEQRVRLRVSDNGTGMDPFVLDRAFEPFFTTKADQGGSGMGLASVYGTVTGMGGTIEIDSQAGVGTSVIVNLPAAEDESAPAVAEEPAAAPPIEGAARRVLVVEDNELVRDMACRMLEANGVEALAATGGREALSILSSHPDSVDVVLTDVLMPETSGPELGQRVAELWPGLAVVYMSGHVRDERTQGLPDDADLLEKPFTEEALLSTIARVLKDRSGV